MSIHRVPVTIVAGLPGVGKTDALADLAQFRPPSERWILLVNFCGEAAVDEVLLDERREEGLEVLTVPGGGLSKEPGRAVAEQVGYLVKHEIVDRIFIECSGMGHLKSIIDYLETSVMQSLIRLQAVVALINPAVLDHPDLMRNPNFIEQVELADILAASKISGQSTDTLIRFREWAESLQPAKDRIETLLDGCLDPGWLEEPHLHLRDALCSESLSPLKFKPNTESEIEVQAPTDPLKPVYLETAGYGFRVYNWRFHPAAVFDEELIAEFSERILEERISHKLIRAKGVFRTEEGTMAVQYGIGQTPDIRHWENYPIESRVELIVAQDKQLNAHAVQELLMHCFIRIAQKAE